jgi:hypothetical protein
MVETRELMKNERRWIRRALRGLSTGDLRNSVRFIAIAVSCFTGAFLLVHRVALPLLAPDWPSEETLPAIAIALMVTTLVVVEMHRTHGRLAELMRPHLSLMREDLHGGVAEVHSDDSVDSFFDRDGDPEEPDLVVRFPEKEIRVDHATYAFEGIDEPVRGWCEVAILPRSGQVLSIKTRSA